MIPFYAYLNRLRLIRRWGLMRNTVAENDMEHSAQAAMVAHALCILAKQRYRRDVSPERAVTLALYHDAGEVITGDLPTPVKYRNPDIQSAYKGLESLACEQLLQMLPSDLQAAYHPYLAPDKACYEWRLVKAADRICAYLKCVEEENAGNREFMQAKGAILKSIGALPMPEVADFMREAVPAFSMTLDELSGL